MITISLASSADFVALILVTLAVRLAYGEINAEALVVVIANNNNLNISKYDT